DLPGVVTGRLGGSQETFELAINGARLRPAREAAEQDRVEGADAGHSVEVAVLDDHPGAAKHRQSPRSELVVAREPHEQVELGADRTATVARARQLDFDR